MVLLVFLLVLAVAVAAQNAEAHHRKLKNDVMSATMQEGVRKRRAMWDAWTGLGLVAVIGLLSWILVSGIPDNVMFVDSQPDTHKAVERVPYP